MSACGIHSACKWSLEEDRGETKRAEMEDSGHIVIVKIILQNGMLTCLDIVLFFFV